MVSIAILGIFCFVYPRHLQLRVDGKRMKSQYVIRLKKPSEHPRTFKVGRVYKTIRKVLLRRHGFIFFSGACVFLVFYYLEFILTVVKVFVSTCC